MHISLLRSYLIYFRNVMLLLSLPASPLFFEPWGDGEEPLLKFLRSISHDQVQNRSIM